MLVTKPQPVPAQNQPRYQFLVLHSSQKSDKQGLLLTWLNVDVKDRIICLTKSFVIDNHVDNIAIARNPQLLEKKLNAHLASLVVVVVIVKVSQALLRRTQMRCLLSAIKVLYLLQSGGQSHIKVCTMSCLLQTSHTSHSHKLLDWWVVVVWCGGVV